ncbi:MAG: FIST N-terminal domain-containing protein [Desulfobacterales bacterium]
MYIQMTKNSDIRSLQCLLESMAAKDDVQSVIVLTCDGNGYTPDQLDPFLKRYPVQIFGGIFPQILYCQEHLEQGTVLVGLPFTTEICLFKGISRQKKRFSAGIDSMFTVVDPSDHSLFVFVDGMAQRIDSLIEDLYNHFGSFPNYIGGGAGSMSLKPSPCIITNNGLLQDAAVVALVDKRCSVGVAHGWHPFSKAIKVTEADLNTVISFDWRPAFDVYREIVEMHSGRRFSEIPFFELAKSYPLGIAKLEAEMVVRDPIIEESGHLVCVGEIPVGSLIYILHGDINSLVAGAASARRLAQQSAVDPEQIQCMFFADCISRVLFMESAFEREMVAVDYGVPLFGALTIGEIANNGNASLEFFNKTAVVGLF